MTQMNPSAFDQDEHVVLHAGAWAALRDLILSGEGAAPMAEALVRDAEVEHDTWVVSSADVLGAQALFSFAADIRTAVEFTDFTGLSVMTDEYRDALNQRANALVERGCDWQLALDDARDATASTGE